MGRCVLVFSPFSDANEPPRPAIVLVSHGPFNFFPYIANPPSEDLELAIAMERA